VLTPDVPAEPQPVRLAVVTSARRGYASLFVEDFVRAPVPGVQLVGIVFCRNAQPTNWQRALKRRLRKVRRIGLLGALNGILMRRWYGSDLSQELGAPDLERLAKQANVPFIAIDHFVDPEAQTVVRGLRLDLGLSLGNSYIAPSFFSIPRLGMLNVHHEWLPDYRGAQSVIWQIHNGSPWTGYSIHEVSKHIDGGPILHRERVALTWGPSLRTTVVRSTADAQRKSVGGLRTVLEDLPTARARALPNTGGGDYTTPSAAAMIRIYRNYRRLRWTR
jgi:methionyl-tRNA formyltransferase